jgi:hypothetical protein
VRCVGEALVASFEDSDVIWGISGGDRPPRGLGVKSGSRS